MNGHHFGHKMAAPQNKVLLKKQLASKILDQLNEYRLKRQLTDAILSVDEEDLHCHRCILAASSPYFQTTFSSQFQEAIDSRIILHDVSPWVMKRILEYIYSGHLEITLDSALDYLRTGHMLHYPDIVDACCNLLSQHLHPTNCLGIKELASLYGCSDLESLANEYILEHFTSVVEKSDELAELPLSSLISYLSADNADICDEAVMWKALSQWVYFDPDNRKQYMYELLSCVRLPVLTHSELTSIANDPLIRSQPKCVQLLEKAFKSGEKIESSLALSDSATGSLLEQRGARPSTLPRDVIVAFGGLSDYELNKVVCYDPLKDRWTWLPALPETVVRASVATSSDTIFVTGGIVNNELSSSVWMFNCKQKHWTRGKSLLTARAKHSSVIMNGMLYLCGGVRMDEGQSVVCMTEIHSYDIKSGVWKRAGFNNSPKLDGTLLGMNNILFEVGGLSDETHTRTMETYRITGGGRVVRTDEHYVLPCSGEPGPLRAAIRANEQIVILWENTGDLFSLSTDGGRFYPLNHTLTNLSGCLVVFDDHAYLLGGTENGKPCTQGRVLDLYNDTSTSISLPPGLIIQKCVQARM